jgi:hypothetical protein
MTRSNKALLVGGAVMLALMIAAASFSLGIYLGNGGWGSGPPAIAGPGPDRAPAGGRDLIRPPDGFPGDEPDLIGRIRAVSKSSLTLDTPRGPRTVQVEETTKFSLPNGEAISMDDLRRGTTVVVFGVPGVGRNSLVARLVLIPPPK